MFLSCFHYHVQISSPLRLILGRLSLASLVYAVQHRMTGWFMNDEFRNISKKVAWPDQDFVPLFAWRVRGKPQEMSVRTGNVPAGLPTRPLWSRNLAEGCAHPERQVALTTKFGTVEPNICGSSVWNLLVFTILEPRILRWLLDFLKI